jgi:hypothetical protein
LAIRKTVTDDQRKIVSCGQLKPQTFVFHRMFHCRMFGSICSGRE